MSDHEPKSNGLLRPPEIFEVVVYRTAGGGVAVWTGPASDWPEQAERYVIREHEVEDHFTVHGLIASETTELEWPAS